MGREMCVSCKKELAKRDKKVSELTEASTCLSMSEKELVVLLDDLSNSIEEVWDVDLTGRITEIYEKLVERNIELMDKLVEGCDKSLMLDKYFAEQDLAKCKKELKECKGNLKETNDSYWILVGKLARCKKERDEERRARTQAEYKA